MYIRVYGYQRGPEIGPSPMSKKTDRSGIYGKLSV